MAHASFATLPLELKAKIVEEAGDQEKAWRWRVKDPEGRVGHINSVSSLALVNKELRDLAAKHQFSLLPVGKASQSVFRYRILPRFGHHISEVIFYGIDNADAAELVLTLLSQLPALRTLRFDHANATTLFGPGVTLSNDPTDEAISDRASVLVSIASKIETLYLLYVTPSQSVAFIRACSNLRSLSFIGLNTADGEDEIRELTKAIASLRFLSDLLIELNEDASGGWSTDALAPLAHDPPPIKYLQLTNFPLDRHIFSLITSLSTTLAHLTLDPQHQDATPDLSSLPLIQLSRLTLLELVTLQSQLPELFRILTSASTLSTFAHLAPAGEAMGPTDPALLTFLNSQPSLVHVSLWDVELERFQVDHTPSDPPSPSFLAAYADLVRSRAGLDPDILDQHHLTPYHPKAQLDYTNNEGKFLASTLRRTLEFGLVELDRLEAEGNVAKAVSELRTDLNSQYADERKNAIKRVIASMTVGKDLSSVFPDVLKNMQTSDLEQKKLVYLYLMNYARSQPELVILAVNTFVKDTDDPNPLIRALAIRTMGCLRADKILDYVCDPLRKCLRDDNPYVRKTAAICVVKLYDLKPALAIDNGFIGQLQEMVTDSNPMVVANAVLALTEIQESADDESFFVLDSATLGRLLVALGECTEWGRIAILNAVAKYVAEDEKEAEHICERVIPQFQHANGSVVLAAIKVIMIHIRAVTREEFIKSILRKMAPPLVTLVSSAPEVQWVALRNINLILQKRPDALANEMRVFFCKYNDPPYVKVEKLEIMIKLATEKNVDTFLSELKEYASEVDVDFVRKAVKAIGQCAIKIEAAAERCVNVLLDLISTRVSYVVQESIVVIKDIFRKYPERYEGIIPTLCASLEELDEPEAKASLIWILGEYAAKIDNADELIGTFLDNYAEEPIQVQLQALTAVVKLFLQKPEAAQALVQRVLALATKTADSPDLRDRAYIQWRLLSSDTEAAKAVILASRPPITLPATSVPAGLLEELLGELGNLSAVYHKPVQAFIAGGKLGADQISAQRGDTGGREAAIATLAAGAKAENLLDFDDDEPDAPSSQSDMFAPPSTTNSTSNPLDDLLGLFGGPSDEMASAPVASFSSQPPPPTNGNNGFGAHAPAGGDMFGDLI
ncbi:hypothetical protein RQP46_002475 [Phenoliferia psychrophenolica]